MAFAPVPRDRGDFSIVLIFAKKEEAECACDVLDKTWDDKEYGNDNSDNNAYTLGAIGEHNVVIIHMPGMGTDRAAVAANQVLTSFRNIKLALVIGVCGGMPRGPNDEEIILGDVMISDALVRYDVGRQYPQGFERKTDIHDVLGPPNEKILSFIRKQETRQRKVILQSNMIVYLGDIQQKSPRTKYPGNQKDILYNSDYSHRHRSPAKCDICQGEEEICEAAVKTECEDLGCSENASKYVRRSRLAESSTPQPAIHFGTMASGNTVMKSGQHRDVLAKDGVLGIEMEGAGAWRYGPTIVIKGVCDYGDSHKRKGWQQYAAATAAACTKAFLLEWTPERRQDYPGYIGILSQAVTVTQIDEVIFESYSHGRLDVERLSGKRLPLESCFINLGIIHHSRDIDIRPGTNTIDRDRIGQQVSQFSLASRLKVQTPSQSNQVTLDILFEPRKQEDGTYARPNRILIWGRAGMGKTTLCKKIVYNVYNRGLWRNLYDRVIWLPLRRLK